MVASNVLDALPSLDGGVRLRVAGLVLLLLAGSTTVVAQSLDATVRTASCDPENTPRYQAQSDLEAAYERRTYRRAAPDTLSLLHAQYGDVVVEAWDSSSVAVEATIVARRPTQPDAEAALSHHGSLTVQLPTDVGAQLRAETNYGEIDVGSPITVQGPISDQIDTTIGDGGALVQLETGDDITIRRSD